MLLVLSPAKALDYERPAHIDEHTTPEFAGRAAELIEVLRKKSPQEVAELMSLSDKLSALNVARYAAWSPRFTAKNSKQAVLAFDGDVYDGLQAASLKPADLKWAQDHVAILSGLYGVLRPLDRMQPYRLEMGTKLKTARGKDLYAYWGDALAEHLNGWLDRLGSKLLVNLASQEYFRSVDRKALKAEVVECVFEDWKGGDWKVISFHAKRARGLMARHIVRGRARTAKALLSFDGEGYAYAPDASEPDRLVFRRRLES
ncbi:MAG: peroxide stress protein YaaA [Aquabacterium sp.]|jgi:cytoplasmic iron level regulating protein YaaA (DUF328/UPF0246 family)|nr:MAG: peroxide stress protein YaaA [Aquabacterium sp.]